MVQDCARIVQEKPGLSHARAKQVLHARFLQDSCTILHDLASSFLLGCEAVLAKWSPHNPTALGYTFFFRFFPSSFFPSFSPLILCKCIIKPLMHMHPSIEYHELLSARGGGYIHWEKRLNFHDYTPYWKGMERYK